MSPVLLFVAVLHSTTENKRTADIIFHKLKNSFNIIRKKIFVPNFPFLMNSLIPPCSLNNQNHLLCMTQVYCQCSITHFRNIFQAKCVKNKKKIPPQLLLVDSQKVFQVCLDRDIPILGTSSFGTQIR